jgi:hypothetical protein
MDKPIEITNQEFEQKMETLDEIIMLLSKQSIKNDIIQNINKDYLKIKREYTDNTILSMCDNKDKLVALKSYHNAILGHNILGKLNVYQSRLDDYAKKQKMKDSVKNEYTKLVNRFKSNIIEIEIRQSNSEICEECGSPTTLYPGSSNIRCSAAECPYIQTLKGDVFDEAQFYSQEGTGGKRAGYEISRHSKQHLDLMMALIVPNIPQEDDDKIDRWSKENNIYWPSMTCESYRSMLKELKLTKYNKYIPYLRKIRSKINPPRLSDEEIREIQIKFEIAVDIYIKIVKEGESNMRYYPFFLSKIIDQVLNKSEDRIRKQLLIDNIHFQRDSTNKDNDNIWNKICDNSDTFVYKITNKNTMYSI